MLELFIDAVRVLVSADTRSALADLTRLVGSSAAARRPTLKTLLVRHDNVEARNFEEAIRCLLHETEDIYVARFAVCYLEAVQNGFDHGCATNSDRIALSVTLEPSAMTLRVTQPVELPGFIRERMARPGDGTAIEFRRSGHSGLAILGHLCKAIRVVDPHCLEFEVLRLQDLDVARRPVRRVMLPIDQFATYADVEVLSLSGRFDHQNTRDFAIDPGALEHEFVLLDISRLEIITSRGAHAMIQLHRALHQIGGALVVFGARGVVREVMSIQRLDQLLMMAVDEEEALAMMARLRGRAPAQDEALAVWRTL